MVEALRVSDQRGGAPCVLHKWVVPLCNDDDVGAPHANDTDTCREELRVIAVL